MRQEYRVRDRVVLRIGGMLLAAGLLCAAWGAASEEGAADGIRQLCASPNGDVIGTVVWDEHREGAVFVWDAATGAARTVFRASGARVTLSLMPGSTPAFASWDAFVSDNAEAAADADAIRQSAYWYDGVEVRRDEWRTGRLCILRQAFPARRSYLVTSAFADGAGRRRLTHRRFAVGRLGRRGTLGRAAPGAMGRRGQAHRPGGRPTFVASSVGRRRRGCCVGDHGAGRVDHV